MDPELKSKLDYMTSVALVNAKKKELLKKIWTKLRKMLTIWILFLNLRVNSALKQEFSRICKLNQSSASSELKRYMLKIVKQGSL